MLIIFSKMILILLISIHGASLSDQRRKPFKNLIQTYFLSYYHFKSCIFEILGPKMVEYQFSPLINRNQKQQSFMQKA